MGSCTLCCVWVWLLACCSLIFFPLLTPVRCESQRLYVCVCVCTKKKQKQKLVRMQTDTAPAGHVRRKAVQGWRVCCLYVGTDTHTCTHTHQPLILYSTSLPLYHSTPFIHSSSIPLFLPVYLFFSLSLSVSLSLSLF